MEWKEKKMNFQKLKIKKRDLDAKELQTTFFSYDDEIIIKNWIISCRKKFAPFSTKSLVCYDGNINSTFNAKSLKIQLRWPYRFLRRH